MVGNVGIFRVFLWDFPFSQLLPTNLLHFSIPLQFISLHILIHFMSSFTPFNAIKNSWFFAPPVYNHAGWRGANWGTHHILLRFTLSLYRAERSGITGYHSSAQFLSQYWQNGSRNGAGRGGNAKNGSSNMNMILQSSFHIVHSPY